MDDVINYCVETQCNGEIPAQRMLVSILTQVANEKRLYGCKLCSVTSKFLIQVIKQLDNKKKC